MVIIIIIIALLPLQWRWWPASSWQVSSWASGCGDRVLRCTQIRSWWAWSKNALSQLSLSQLSIVLRVLWISFDFLIVIYFHRFSYEFYRFSMFFFEFHRFFLWVLSISYDLWFSFTFIDFLVSFIDFLWFFWFSLIFLLSFIDFIWFWFYFCSPIFLLSFIDFLWFWFYFFHRFFLWVLSISYDFLISFNIHQFSYDDDDAGDDDAKWWWWRWWLWWCWWWCWWWRWWWWWWCWWQQSTEKCAEIFSLIASIQNPFL